MTKRAVPETKVKLKGYQVQVDPAMYPAYGEVEQNMIFL